MPGMGIKNRKSPIFFGNVKQPTLLQEKKLVEKVVGDDICDNTIN